MLIFWAVLGGFLLDALFGDPAWLPHPVVLMGRCISALEKHLRTALPKTPRATTRLAISIESSGVQSFTRMTSKSCQVWFNTDNKHRSMYLATL